jgi:hypothetical protein
VVYQRRDPVLVTTAGRDRILVQCFPVQPNRGEMRIRIGITVPLVLENTNNVRLLFPRFVSRNFKIPNDLTHSTWIESKAQMTASKSALMAGRSNSQTFTMGGGIYDADLSAPGLSIKLSRANVSTWSKDPFENGKFIIQQSVIERLPSHLYRIVLVVDTSEPMESFASDIRAALRAFPSQFDVKLVLANSDEAQNIIASGVDEISTILGSARFGGGADNTPALVKAWDLAAEKPGNNAIVWIHAPQRLQLHSVWDLTHRWERSPYGPTLYSLQAVSGSDVIEKTLDGTNEVKTVARVSSLLADLENLLSRLTGQTKTLEFVRTSMKVDGDPSSKELIETSDHLARLWANDEVTRILNARDQTLNNAAITLAARYQLVTPVTGAVVLENAQQYTAAGLKPVDEGTVPTIPEPEIVALLIVAAIFLTWVAWRKHRTITGGGCTV